MGLRTASVRRQHAPVMVMAPALSKQPNEANNYKLASSSPSISPSLNGHECKPLINNGYGTEPDVLKSAVASGIMSSSPPHMGDSDLHPDAMGLQKSGVDAVTSFIKEKKGSEGDDHVFNNIATTEPDIAAAGDIVQNVEEIMQVIKSMDNGSDKLFADLASNLSSFEKDVLNDVDLMNMTMEEPLIDGGSSQKESRSKELISELQKRQLKLERRSAFLLRRLRKIQSKYMGQHVSEEVAGVFEHIHRTLRHSSKSTDPSAPLPTTSLKPITQSSARNLVRKLESAVTLQASALAKQRHMHKYMSPGEASGSRNSSTGLSVPSWSPEAKKDLERVSGMLHSEVRLVQEEIDSDATLSSSGGESCDEMQSHNNPQQQYLPM